MSLTWVTLNIETAACFCCLWNHRDLEGLGYREEVGSPLTIPVLRGPHRGPETTPRVTCLRVRRTEAGRVASAPRGGIPGLEKGLGHASLVAGDRCLAVLQPRRGRTQPNTSPGDPDRHPRSDRWLARATCIRGDRTRPVPPLTGDPCVSESRCSWRERALRGLPEPERGRGGSSDKGKGLRKEQSTSRVLPASSKP